MSIKADFPIFANHPDLVYLDSAATSQKPSYVIDGVKTYLENDYANIHRGWYELSERSEELFWQARKAVAKLINANEKEIIFTANSTGASNLLAQSLARSELLEEGDTILLTELEHHANLVPWQLIAEQYGYQIEYVAMNDDFSLDLNDLAAKASGAKLLSITYVSNVTGGIQPLQQIKEVLPDEVLVSVDASQAVPHMEVDVHSLDCDFLFFTGHKMFAFTGIGVLYGRQELLKKIPPAIGGGSAIAQVTTTGYELLGPPDKFEPGTPNLIGVVSLLKAIEYAETKGGFVAIGEMEHDITKQALQGLIDRQTSGELRLLGPATMEERIGLFSFQLTREEQVHKLGQYMALQQVCIRCGGQCSHPLHTSLGTEGSCRMSLAAYNTAEDIELFFTHLDTYLAGQ